MILLNTSSQPIARLRSKPMHKNPLKSLIHGFWIAQKLRSACTARDTKNPAFLRFSRPTVVSANAIERNVNSTISSFALPAYSLGDPSIVSRPMSIISSNRLHRSSLALLDLPAAKLPTGSQSQSGCLSNTEEWPTGAAVGIKSAVASACA